MDIPAFRTRPMTIYESDDPTLDPAAILHALPPQDRVVPGTISMVLCGAFMACLAFWPELLTTEIQGRENALRTTLQHMNILLESSHLPTPKPGPAGGGGTPDASPRWSPPGRNI